MIPQIHTIFHFMCLICPICGKFPRIILLWLASWPACGMITCDKGTQGATMAEWAATSPTSIQPPKPDYEHTSVSFVYINHVMWFLMLLCLFFHPNTGKMGWNWIDLPTQELPWSSLQHGIKYWSSIVQIMAEYVWWFQVITWTNELITKQMHHECFLTPEQMEIHGCIFLIVATDALVLKIVVKSITK